MDKIEIEKGVPIVAGVRNSRKYPFHQMNEVGDSFFIGAQTGDEERSMAMSIAASGRRYGKLVGMKFSVKRATRVDSEGKVFHGVRCWRVA